LAGTVAYGSIREGIGQGLFALFYYYDMAFGSVVVLQALFTTVIGRQSPVANVLSTLAIAALFTPIRRRIQTFIDRRFYRQKYDAERVLATFSTNLRDEVDLDHLTSSILAVTRETLQPEHATLWLREVNLQPRGQPME